MSDKLMIAIENLFDALTTHWEDNGNILADAVRDKVVTSLSQITSMSVEEVMQKVQRRIDDAQ